MERRLASLSTPEPLASVTARPHGLLEAPRPRGDGTVLYADVMLGGVHRVGADGSDEPMTVLPKRRGIGGLVGHRDGGIVVSGRSVLHADGEHQRELLALEGVTGFNDLATDPSGRVLAGALRFLPFAGEQPVPTEVWRIAGPDDAEPVAEGLDWPNGIGVSPDGARLYVSDTANGVVRAYDLGSGDTRGEVFATTPGAADGMAVDVEGGLWVALGDAGLARFTADGALDGVARLPVAFASSVCFGGADLRDVFITTADNPLDPEKGGTILRARSEIAGLAVTPAAV